MEENWNNPKKLCSLIKELSRDFPTKHGVDQLHIDGETITEENNIAELLNLSFVNQATILLGSVDSCVPVETLASSPMQVNPNMRCTFELPFNSPAKVFKMLQEMPTSKATGANGLGVQLLKIAASAIAEPISRLINRCISTRNVPSKWKIEKVSPVFKTQGSNNDKQNYRPISVLLIVSKIFERHIYDSLYSHLSRNNLLYGLQSGFRKKHSTKSALIRLLDQTLFDIDNNNMYGLVCWLQ